NGYINTSIKPKERMENCNRTLWPIGIFFLSLILISPFQLFAQETVISGTVKDADTAEPLIGVNILVKGQVIGTISDLEGNFSLNLNQPPPLTLIFSMVGYSSQERVITDNNSTSLEVNLSEQTLLGQEIVVSASRVEESILQSPVSIEKMDILSIRNSPADTYYK